MSISIYNTLTKNKGTFSPIEEGHVKMYVCGPTVYDLLHIGNFRGAIFFNMVKNWLESEGLKVTYVYNYTDVDDKIIKKAIAEGVESTVISEKYIEEFRKDFFRLGLKEHDHNPKVTEFMPEIIKFVEDLVDNKHAYVVEGEVFFSIPGFPTYGKLSGKKLDELNSGERVEVDKKKQNPLDFVLWKPSKEGEPSWDSPWGKGRPGWHIECSAMIQAILGDTIDIHGGGIDLIFPHHENEIAQGEGRTGKPYCSHWMHNNFIILKDQKMSKSLGNIITGRSFMDKYHPEILKHVMLSVHYRSQLNVNEEKIIQSIQGLSRVYNSLKDADFVIKNSQLSGGKVNKTLMTSIQSADAKIKKALNDDFNSGEMMANIFEVVRSFNSQNVLKKLKDPNTLATAKFYKEWILKYGNILALFLENPDEILKKMDDILLLEKKIERSDIDKLIVERTKAREEKDWAKSDVVRDKLVELGIETFDSPEGTTWTVKK